MEINSVILVQMWNFAWEAQQKDMGVFDIRNKVIGALAVFYKWNRTNREDRSKCKRL